MKIKESKVILPDDDATKILKEVGKNLSEIKPNGWSSGQGAPTENIGTVGDFYLNEETNDYFYKTLNGWLQRGNIHGSDGIDGADGLDGEDGKSAYQVWLDQGNSGTANDFILSLVGNQGPRGLVGPPGRKGDRGEKGEKGEDGKDGREIELRKSETHIQWRYTDDRNWTNLVALDDLKTPGDTNIFAGGGGGGSSEAVAGGGSGIIETLVAGDNITIDATDPANPIISSTGGVVLGETSTTAYRGDRGKTAYDHSQLTSGNPHSVTKTDVGLGNADNTSDANKPVSTAQATAIGVVQTDINTHEANVSNPHSVTKTQVGLPNVDNTSDANKPVSSATQTALDLKANDADVVHDTGAETIAGVKTFSSDPIIPDEAYSATDWNGSLEPPTKNAVRDKFESLSSGGQVTYDAIVAASGGDYTTLGAAITAASAGWRIFVKDGTYSESAISSSLANLTIEGESNNLAIISHGANNITLSGANCTIRNLGFTGSTSTLQVSGAETNIQRCRFAYTSPATSLASCRFSGGKGSVSNNFFSNTTTSTPTASFVEIGGSYMSFNANHIEANARTTSANTGVLRSGGGSNTITGNTFLGLQNSLNNGFVINSGEDAITGNTFINWMDSGFTNQARILLGGGTFSGNRVNGAYLDLSTAETTVSGNRFNHTNGSSGIIINAVGCVVSGNVMLGNNGCPTAITVSNTAADNCVIIGNYIHRYTTNSVNVSSSSHDNVIIAFNNFDQTTTPIANSGLGTIIMGNFNTYPADESQQISATNTSGGTVNAGELVVLKAVASGNEVTTTTSAGDNKVYGMALAAINNNAKGRILIKGKTTLLKVDGTLDIAIGDYITTFTTAGIGAKAIAGQTVIAIALEAYTTDDSNGVIDALLISPRII